MAPLEPPAPDRREWGRGRCRGMRNYRGIETGRGLAAALAISVLTSIAVTHSGLSGSGRPDDTARRPPRCREGHPRPWSPTSIPRRRPSSWVRSPTSSYPPRLWPDLRQRLLVTGWLTGLRSPRTRRAYAETCWPGSAGARRCGVDPLRSRRVQVDLYLAGLFDSAAAPASPAGASRCCRRSTASCSSRRTFTSPRPTPPWRCAGPRWTPSTPSPSETKRLRWSTLPTGPVAHSGGATPPCCGVLLHNALRVDELLGADLTDLGHPSRLRASARHFDHRRKGGRRARIALAPARVESLQHYLQDRGRRKAAHPGR